jgi:hypothetical protein
MRYFSIFKDYFSLSDGFLPEYRLLKYQYPNDKELVSHLFNLDNGELDDYFRYKNAWLEDDKYLSMDTLLIDPILLMDCFMRNDAKVLTIRKSQHAFHKQLSSLGIGFLKEKAVVLISHGMNTKYDWLLEHTNGEAFIMIGDSEVDMCAGIIPHCTSIFVKTGLRDYDKITDCLKPHYVYNSLQDCLESIL